MFTEYRSARLSGDIADLKGRKSAVSFRTCNNEQDLLNAVIVELKRMGEWKGENPLDSVRQFRLHETEMEFLTVDEMRELIAKAEAHVFHKDLHKIIKLCLATGARFSEAANLTGAQLAKNIKLPLTQTKGKRIARVPISKDIYELIYKEGSQGFV
ncbi:phage integrase [Vibrio metschnikovii]